MTRLAHVVAASVSGYATSIRAGHHALTSDEPVASGGTDTGPPPFQLVLAGLGACTAITLRMYGDRKSWTLGTIRIDLEMLREGDATRIRRVVTCSEPLTAEQRAKLVEIAGKTPVTKVLQAGSAIETEVRDSAT